MAKTVEQIIDDLGGAAAIARAVPVVKEGAIRVWKHRKIIPRAAWPDLIEAFPDQLSLEVLRQAEAA
jgi:hypothetical protein